MTLPRWIFTALLAGLSLSAMAGQVYKYVDPQGRVHYADRPKPGWTAVDVRPPPTSNAPPASTAEDSGAEGDPEAPPAAGSSTEPPVDRAAQCKSQREQLDTYKAAARITEKDGLGRERDYTPQERDLLIRRTEEQVKQACAP